jgi:hypothetical protein
MMHLLAARRRYVGMRKALPCDCALDIDLHEELTQAIRRIDGMIARAADDRPSPALSGAAPRRGGPTPGRRRRTEP